MEKRLLLIVIINIQSTTETATCSLFEGDSTKDLVNLSGTIETRGKYNETDICTWQFLNPYHSNAIFRLDITYFFVKHNADRCGDDGFLALPNGTLYCRPHTQSDEPDPCFMYTTTQSGAACKAEVDWKCTVIEGKQWPPSITLNIGSEAKYNQGLNFNYTFEKCTGVPTNGGGESTAAIITTTESESTNLVIPVAAVSAGVFLLAIIALIIVIKKRRKTNSHDPKSDNNRSTNGNETRDLNHRTDIADGYDTLHAVMSSASYATVDTNIDDEAPEAMYATADNSTSKNQAPNSHDAYSVVVKTPKSSPAVVSEPRDEGLNATYSVLRKKTKSGNGSKSEEPPMELYTMVNKSKPQETSTYDTLSHENTKLGAQNNAQGEMYASLDVADVKAPPGAPTYDTFDRRNAPETAPCYGTLDLTGESSGYTDMSGPKKVQSADTSTVSETNDSVSADQEPQVYAVVNKKPTKKIGGGPESVDG